MPICPPLCGFFYFIAKDKPSMGNDHAIEQAVIIGSSNLIKGSGVTAVASGAAKNLAENPDLLSMADFGVIVGIIGVVVGLSVNGFYQWRKDKRDGEFHQERMAAYRRKSN